MLATTVFLILFSAFYIWLQAEFGFEYEFYINLLMTKRWFVTQVIAIGLVIFFSVMIILSLYKKIFYHILSAAEIIFFIYLYKDYVNFILVIIALIILSPNIVYYIKNIITKRGIT